MTLPDAGVGQSVVRNLTGVLYLRAPSPHIRTRLGEILSSIGLRFEVRSTILGVQVERGALDRAVAALIERLSAAEAGAILAVFYERGTELDVESLFSAVPLSVLQKRRELPQFIQALQRDGAQTWFQPIVPADEPGVPFAYEALIRVQMGDRLLSGYEVIELARAADIMMNVDRIARMNAVRAAKERSITECIFLNFSPLSVHDPAFGLTPLMRRATGAGIDLHNICFEIVESERILDYGHARAIIDEHRANGCKFALDDLGAGYSSLNLVHRLHPDFIKIDMDLVRGIHVDPYKQSIVRHVIDAAASLGIRSIAEGVETQAEFEWLRYEGVNYVQGYYIARPALHPPLKAAV